MKFYKYILFTIFFISYHAQDKKWTLRECVDYALKNNINIKSSELDVKNSEINKSDAFGNFLPTLNLGGNQGWQFGFSIDPITNDRTNQTNRYTGFQLSSNVDIYKGLQNVNQLKRARLSIIAAQYQLTKIQEDVALNVANSYLQILFNKENLKVQKKQLETNLKQSERTKQLVQAGNVPKGDLLDIEATIATDKQRVIVAENTLLISKLSLAQLLQFKDFQIFDVNESDIPSMLSTILNEKPEIVAKRAKETRTELKIAQTNLDLAQKDIDISKGAYMPTISLGLGANSNISYNKFATGFNQVTGEISYSNPKPFFRQLEDNFGQSINLSVSIPIFNGFRTRNSVQRNYVNLERAKLNYQQQETDIDRNVYTAYTDAKGAKESFEAAEKVLKARELSLEYAKSRYEIGVMNIFDFNQAQTALANAQSEVLRSKYDYIFRIKILEFYFGIPLIEKQ